MYADQHISEQIDRHLECAVMEKPQSLSPHAPISFSRRLPSKNLTSPPPLKPSTILQDEWPSLVEANCRLCCSRNLQAEGPQRLTFLKLGMRQASKKLSRDSVNRTAQTHEERMNATMSMLRAAERWA